MVDNLTWVEKAYSWNSGGGCWIDVLVLSNGTCLSITDESVIVWESERHFLDYEVVQDGDELHNYVCVGLDTKPMWVHQSVR